MTYLGMFSSSDASIVDSADDVAAEHAGQLLLLAHALALSREAHAPLRYERTHGGQVGDLGSEGVGVALQDDGDGLLADGLVFDVVAAAIAIAVFTVLPTRKALAVQLQAPRVLAVAVLLPIILLGARLAWGAEAGAEVDSDGVGRGIHFLVEVNFRKVRAEVRWWLSWLKKR